MRFEIPLVTYTHSHATYPLHCRRLRPSGHLDVEAASAAPRSEYVDEVAQVGFLALVDLFHGL